MALAITCRFDTIDNKGKTSFTKVRIPTGFALADMLDFAVQMAQLLANILTTQITRAGICVSLDLSTSTIKANPLSGADAAQKGFFGFATGVTGFRTRMRLPAFNETLVNAGSDTIDQSDTDVAAFITAMEDGIVVTGGTVSPTDNRENDIVSTDYAREIFRGT